MIMNEVGGGGGRYMLIIYLESEISRRAVRLLKHLPMTSSGTVGAHIETIEKLVEE